MHLLTSTEGYKLNGGHRKGFPILLWEDMRNCREGNEFLRYYLSREAIRSTNSWQPIARGIYHYFGFLEACGLDWRDVSRGGGNTLVAGYRDYCFEVSKLGRSTIRQRLTYICAFYKFALLQGWISRLPNGLEIHNLVQPERFLARVSASGVEASSVMQQKHRHMRFLTPEEAKKLLTAAQNVHHKAIIRLALETGLRRWELATFPLKCVFDPDNSKINSQTVCVTIDPVDDAGIRTMGSKPRKILMSSILMSFLYSYAIRHRGERASLSKYEHKHLFLNQNGEPWSRDGKGIEAIVRKLGEKIGVHASPQILRNTYATRLQSELRRNGKNNQLETLKLIKEQLGHTSIYSTMSYLEASHD